jgi:hypothetical protein
VTNARGHEEMARSEIDRTKNGEIADAARLERFHESPARAAKLRSYSSRHQLAAESSMSRCVRSRCNGVTDT